MFEFLEPEVPQITAEKVKQASDTNQKVVLLDVRTPGEFARGKIEGAINLPVDQVPAKISSVLPDKSVTIYVYCLSGSRSVFAVDAMLKLGYENVFNLTSGLLAWRSLGYQLIQ